MGLRKQNYEIKELGVTLPTAYALIKNLDIDGSSGVAKIVVQQSRDLALTKEALEEVDIHFIINNRNENPYTAAYRAAKAINTVKIYNKQTGKYEDVQKYAYFYDWQDDIT